MNNLEKYNKQSLVEFDGLFDDKFQGKDSGTNLFAIILKRWKMVLLIFSIVSAIGIPAIWFTVKPFYLATAAVRVSPVIANLLSGGQEGIPMYRSFICTQAELITSDKMLQDVAKDLSDKGIVLSYKANGLFEVINSEAPPLQTVGNVSSLRSAVIGRKLTVSADDDTELIKIYMKNPDPGKAAEIANSFVRAYMTFVASEESNNDTQQMASLENESKTLENEIKKHNAALYQIAQEYGTTALNSRQEMLLSRITKLQEKLTELEMDKIALQVRMNLVETKEAADDLSKSSDNSNSDYVNSDPITQALAENAAKLEQELVTAREQMVPTNPKLIRKEALLEAVKQRLQERRKEIADSQMQQLTTSENQIRDLLAKEDANTIELGRKQLAMQEVQSRLNLSKELYDTVQRRIKELEMENKQPARISVAYYANTVPFQDNRKKYSMVCAIFAIMCGMGLTLFRDRLDPNVRTPQDMTKHIDVRILGTTTSGKRINKLLWTRQIDDDYQSICANFGLLDGQSVPHSVVITSPCPRDGKSTLAANLAANLAKLGKKVLLIDGDLRKPDIAEMMNLNDKGLGLQCLISGATFEAAVSSTDIPGLSVLKAYPCEASVIYRLLDQSRTAGFIDNAKKIFDHIIIDSPPILVAIDALLWAKMADGVILTSLAGRTKSADLTESMMRLRQAGIKVFGAVLSNVTYNSTYHPYGYGAYVKSIVAKNDMPSATPDKA